MKNITTLTGYQLLMLGTPEAHAELDRRNEAEAQKLNRKLRPRRKVSKIGRMIDFDYENNYWELP